MIQGDGDGASEAKAPRRVGRNRGVGGRGGAARNVNATSRDGLKRSKGQRDSDMITVCVAVPSVRQHAYKTAHTGF